MRWKRGGEASSLYWSLIKEHKIDFKSKHMPLTVQYWTHSNVIASFYEIKSSDEIMEEEGLTVTKAEVSNGMIINDKSHNRVTFYSRYENIDSTNKFTFKYFNKATEVDRTIIKNNDNISLVDKHHM